MTCKRFHFRCFVQRNHILIWNLSNYETGSVFLFCYISSPWIIVVVKKLKGRSAGLGSLFYSWQFDHASWTDASQALSSMTNPAKSTLMYLRRAQSEFRLRVGVGESSLSTDCFTVQQKIWLPCGLVNLSVPLGRTERSRVLLMPQKAISVNNTRSNDLIHLILNWLIIRKKQTEK